MGTNKLRHACQVLLVLVLIGIGLAGFKMLKSSREALGREQPQQPLPLVRTVPVTVGTVDMVISGEGTVRPEAEIQLISQVSGRVDRISDQLANGGEFKKGDCLLRIDPRDYEIAVTQAAAGVKDAHSQYELARQEAEAAQAEWQRIHPGQKAPPLVARKPQLAAARAYLQGQQASLAKARLNLERTRLLAPFKGRVRAKQVDKGQYVTPGQVLAVIYATNSAEIVVPLESQDLQWLDVPGFTAGRFRGTSAKVQARVAGLERSWPGRVVRTEGTIDSRTRLINLVVRVKAPYDRYPPLMVGQFVTVKLFGRDIKEAALIPRAALKGQQTIWTVDPEKKRLNFKTVSVVHRDERGVVIQNDLQGSELVVISPLKNATDGMRVRYSKLDPGE